MTRFKHTDVRHAIKAARESVDGHNSARYTDITGPHYDPGTMLSDGPELRRRILANGERWGNRKTYAGYARQSTTVGMIDVLRGMVAEGLMETDVFKVSLGRWKYVKREQRPDMRVWRRTAAGVAELARLEALPKPATPMPTRSRQ